MRCNFVLVLIILFFLTSCGYAATDNVDFFTSDLNFSFDNSNATSKTDILYKDNSIPSVEMLKETKTKVIVAGRVKKVGITYIEKGDTLLDAISSAGGEEVHADLSRIQIVHNNGAQPETINLKSFLAGKDISANPVLNEDDVVVIPEEITNDGSFSILGEIQRPGIYEINGETRLDQVLLNAGGFGKDAQQDYVILKHAGGAQRKLSIDKIMAKDPNENFKISSGDTIYVFTVEGRFNVIGSVSKPGVYPLKGPIRATDAIALAGGYTNKAKISEIKLLKAGSETPVSLNLYEINNNPSKNIVINTGDTLVVPENKESNFWRVLSAIGSFGGWFIGRR